MSTATDNPLDRLYGIAERLRLVLDDKEDSAWLLHAIDDHVYAGIPLDESLALKGDSQGRSPRWRMIDRQQAMLIREALFLCGGNKASLAREIKKYKLRKQSFYANKPAPAGWHELLKLIHAACQLKDAPDTGQGIYYLLSRN